ncbi:putative bifunctional diguanylate cyclase/phosphodiesterase [Planococcus chinensis]|uniref:EAL domain-containing protein n=1 Tax=Planococcus chinensis TaxID=272917 RepID=A0ABW4QE71_9BACL
MSIKEMNEERRIVIDWLRRIGVEFQTGFIITNPEAEDNPIVYANQTFLEMCGYSENEVIGKNGRFLHGKKTDQLTSKEIRTCIDNGEACTREIINYRKDGVPFWNEITIQPIDIEETEGRFTLMLLRDITDRKRAEALIKLQQETYYEIEKGYMLSYLIQKACSTVESFFHDDAKCTVLLVGDDGRFRAAAGTSMPNRFHEAISEIYAEENTGTCGAAFHRKETVVVEDMKTDPLWKDYQNLVDMFGLVSSWSVPILDADGNAIGTFGIYFPFRASLTPADREFIEGIAPIVSLIIKYFRQQEDILELAYVDKETSLPNRNYFMNEIGDMVNEQKEGFIAFISTDEYVKMVDQYGHRAGDALVKEIGKRFLLAKLPADNLIARFSDSTIAIFCQTPLTKVPDCLEVLGHCTAEPASIQDMELFLTLKMGVAIITPKQNDPDELIRHADSALSKAKLRAGESICYYENEHDEFMMRDLRIANELTAAIRREEINVHLQPKVDLNSGAIVSFEALARWFSTELGNISPDVFIPAAEKNGKIRMLEQHVLKRVLSWLKKRREHGLDLRQVAVNISTDHFFHHSFIPYLVDTAAEYGIEPEWLRLEITERIGFVDIETAYKVFKQLQNYGFTSSIDDFGTGYSSLSYLQKLPVHEIKIDRSFVSRMHEPATLAIVRTIVQLAGNLGMVAVAEGIETEEQRRMLIDAGCRYGQGFYFYRPMSLEEANLL